MSSLEVLQLLNTNVKKKPIDILPSWINAADEICKEINGNKRLKVMVLGNKGIGKNTLCNFLVNRILSSDQVSESKGCYLMDLDLNQKNQSLPGTLSLCKYKEPILEESPFLNGYSNDDNVRVLIGTTNLNFCFHGYTSAVAHLNSLCSQNDSPVIISSLPLIDGENTFLLLESIKLINPTHVVHIFPHDMENAKDTLPTAENINDKINNGGWFNGGLSVVSFDVRTELNYEYLRVDFSKSTPYYRKKRKDIVCSIDEAINSYFSSIWKTDEVKFCIQTVNKVHILDFRRLALHVSCQEVDFSEILIYLNGSLVNLCHVDDNQIESVEEDLPKRINTCKVPNSLTVCHGWAIVAYVDMEAKTICVISPEDPEMIDSKVNALIRSDVALPLNLSRLLNNGQEYLKDRIKREKQITSSDNGKKKKIKSDGKKEKIKFKNYACVFFKWLRYICED